MQRTERDKLKVALKVDDLYMVCSVLPDPSAGKNSPEYTPVSLILRASGSDFGHVLNLNVRETDYQEFTTGKGSKEFSAMLKNAAGAVVQFIPVRPDGTIERVYAEDPIVFFDHRTKMVSCFTLQKTA